MLVVRFEMVSIEKLKSFRGYFIVVAFIIAAVVTPPDVISQLALAIPMCLLYELGIIGARWFARGKPTPKRTKPLPRPTAPRRRDRVNARRLTAGARGRRSVCARRLAAVLPARRVCRV